MSGLLGQHGLTGEAQCHPPFWGPKGSCPLTPPPNLPPGALAIPAQETPQAPAGFWSSHTPQCTHFSLELRLRVIQTFLSTYNIPFTNILTS